MTFSSLSAAQRLGRRSPREWKRLVRNAGQSDFFRVVNEMGEKKPRVIVHPQLSRLPVSFERFSVARDLWKAGCEISFVPLEPTRSRR